MEESLYNTLQQIATTQNVDAKTLASLVNTVSTIKDVLQKQQQEINMLKDNILKTFVGMIVLTFLYIILI